MERELVEWLRKTLPTSSRVTVGFGDDAAVLAAQPREIVVTCDAVIEGVHFDQQLNYRAVGRKALAINLSDLAAMAAEPLAAVVTLGIPPHLSLNDVKELYHGMLPLAEEFGLDIIGGDTNTGSDRLIIAVTAIGQAPKQGVWRLSGAAAGDQIVVTGSFGASLSGKHFAFEPRCRTAQYLQANYTIHAATDVSDGLSVDLIAMARASSVGVVVDEDLIPISPDLRSAIAGQGAGPERTAIDRALSDGEDFELILAVPPDQGQRLLDDVVYGAQLTVIGEFTQHSTMRLRDRTGSTRPMAEQGYEH